MSEKIIENMAIAIYEATDSQYRKYVDWLYEGEAHNAVKNRYKRLATAAYKASRHDELVEW